MASWVDQTQTSITSALIQVIKPRLALWSPLSSLNMFSGRCLRSNKAIIFKFNLNLNLTITEHSANLWYQLGTCWDMAFCFISFGRSLVSTRAILFKFTLDFYFMIIRHPAKFHKNQFRTFWLILITERQRDRKNKTDRQTHTSKTISPLNAKFWERQQNQKRDFCV